MQAGTEPRYAHKVLCYGHVHVPEQYNLTKHLVGPSSDHQLHGTNPALKVEPGQHSLTTLGSDHRLELVRLALILDSWEERSTCKEKCRGCKHTGGFTAAGSRDKLALEGGSEAGFASEL